MARLVHQGPTVKFPGTPPGVAVVVSLGAAPEDIDRDHEDPAEPTLLNRPFQELQGRVAAVLLDHEQTHSGPVTRLDHRQAVAPPSRHRLFGHHVTTRRRALDGLGGVEPARCSENDDVRVRVPQHGAQRAKSGRLGLRDRPLQPAGIRVAHADHVHSAGMLAQGLQVLFRNAPATCKCETQLSVDDRRLLGKHQTSLIFDPASGGKPE